MVRLTIAITLLLVIGSALARPPSRDSGRRVDHAPPQAGELESRRERAPRPADGELEQRPRGDAREGSRSRSDDEGSFNSEEESGDDSSEEMTTVVPEAAGPMFPEPLRRRAEGGRAAEAAENRPDAAQNDEDERSRQRGRAGKGRREPSAINLIRAACSVVNTTSGEIVRQRNCSEGVSCGLGPLTVPACYKTLFTLTFCDAPPPREDDDEAMGVPEEDFEDIDEEDLLEFMEKGDVDEPEEYVEDESSEVGEMRRHRRRPRGLPALACSLQGNGVDITRPCHGNDTCDLGSLTLPLNGTTVTALFCQPPEGAQSRPCPDHDREEELEGERSRPRGEMRDGNRSGPRSDRGEMTPRDEGTEVGATEDIETEAVRSRDVPRINRQGRRQGGRNQDQI